METLKKQKSTMMLCCFGYDHGTNAQTIIMNRIEKKTHFECLCNSYDVHGDTYGDYLDEPYGDYYDTNSEEPH